LLEATDTGVIVTVRVIPRARKTGLAGTRDNALLVRLSAPPVDGAANAELIAVLAEAFAIPKRLVTIASGDQSRIKRVRLSGANLEAVRSRIEREEGRG
jgi:hypothetical protein